MTENYNIKESKLQSKAAQILETVKSVSEQQEEVFKKLDIEQMKLEEEISELLWFFFGPVSLFNDISTFMDYVIPELSLLKNSSCTIKP